MKHHSKTRDYRAGASGGGPIRKMTRGSFLGAETVSELLAELSVGVDPPPLPGASAANSGGLPRGCF